MAVKKAVRTESVSFRISEIQKNRWREVAEWNGMSLTGFIIESVRKNVETILKQME